MKRYYILILLAGLSLVLTTSCLKKYLDKSPESGLTETEVFAKYENFIEFLDGIYDGRKLYDGSWYDYSVKNAYPTYFDMWDQKYGWEGLTDAADGGRYMEGHTFKSGQVSGFINKFTYDGKRRPILESMFTCIRIANKSLENMYLLEENLIPKNLGDTALINDLKGQCYYFRAFCHFELFRLWGPMPYITKTLDPGDQFDLARLSKHQTLNKIAQDLDTSIIYFRRAKKMRRDAGSFNDSWQARPTGVAAMALRARTLLYAASPLNNQHGIADWDTAAKANWQAIDTAKKYNYSLLTIANRKNMFYGQSYTAETLWGYTWGSQSWNWGNWQAIINGIFGASVSSWAGIDPTQNWVDKYESKWGDPLNTQADRDAASLLVTGTTKHYVEQNPYANRDPRLDIDVIFNQGACQGWTNGKAQIYYTINEDGSFSYSELLDRAYLGNTKTGYYERKRWANQSQKAKNSATISTPLIRLAELYLNYAEAANEAYGPNVIPSYATKSGLTVLNEIRTRAGMPAVLPAFTGSAAALRPRIRNEQDIEFSFEGHHYHDIRRWKDAPVAYGSTLFGMDIEKLPAGYNAAVYPTGFRYTRIPLSFDRQPRWKEAMYYLPFTFEDNFRMKNFVPNEVW